MQWAVMPTCPRSGMVNAACLWNFLMMLKM